MCFTLFWYEMIHTYYPSGLCIYVEFYIIVWDSTENSVFNIVVCPNIHYFFFTLVCTIYKCTNYNYRYLHFFCFFLFFSILSVSFSSHISLSYCCNWGKSPYPLPSRDSRSAEAAIPTRPGGESGYPPSGAGLLPRQTTSPLTSGCTRSGVTRCTLYSLLFLCHMCRCGLHAALL